MGVRFANDAVYTEAAVCERLDVTPRWLRKHVPHSGLGRKRWYSGADLNTAMARRDPNACPSTDAATSGGRSSTREDLSTVSARVLEIRSRLLKKSAKKQHG
jgi:hypothetical protein